MWRDLFRIVQEALNNIEKHSGSEIATVTIEISGDTVEASISDKGVGIDSTLKEGNTGHFGFETMKERAEQYGGKLNIVSNAGKGTSVDVWIPIEYSEEEDE